MNLLKKLAFTVATVGVIWNCPAMDLELVALDRTIGYETFAERIDVFSRTQTSSTANDYVGKLYRSNGEKSVPCYFE